jgi:hypothetical protein
MTTSRSYEFGPAAAQGALGTPLSWLQLSSLVGGLTGAYALFGVAGIGVPLALATLALSVAVAFVPVAGRELVDWAPVVAWFVVRRVARRLRRSSAAPTAGFAGTARDPSGPGQPPELTLPGGLDGVEIVAASFSGQQVGIVADRKRRTWSAVLKVRVRSFGLLAQSDQERRVDAWAALLTGLCREGTPVGRVQWLERTIPTDVDELAAYFLTALGPDGALDADSRPVRSYEDLISGSTAATQDHELFLLVQVSHARAKALISRLAPGNADEGACLLLQQELVTLAEALAACEVDPLGALRPRTLAKVVRLGFDPFQRRALDRLGLLDPAQDGTDAANAHPLATDTGWDHYRTDGAVHATYWVAEWPRRAVGATFLLPLLLQGTMQRTISVVMEPVPTSRALARVEAEIVGDDSTEHMRRSRGFNPTTRRAKRSEDLRQRARELGDGWGEYRYAGYVTVSATTRDELEHACAQTEHRALQSRLHLRRLHGQQDTAFTYTLPLGRGLA